MNFIQKNVQNGRDLRFKVFRNIQDKRQNVQEQQKVQEQHENENTSSVAQFLKNPTDSGGSSSVVRNKTFTSENRTTSNETSNLNEPPAVIVAITEGRNHAQGEVGIAAIDINRPHLIICQLSDNVWYTGTLTKLNLLSPVEILFPNTFKMSSNESKIITAIEAMYPTIPTTPIPRRHYSDSEAKNIIGRYCAEAYKDVQSVIDEKYYALCAAGAILTYVTTVKKTRFAPNSLKIEYQAKHGTMMIDVETAQRLELVYSLSSTTNKKGCLFDILNKCSTPIGRRSLRAKILEPSCDIRTITEVQNCVRDLISKEEILYSLKSSLRSFQHVDKLSNIALLEPHDDNVKAAEVMINRTLQLKICLESIPELLEILGETETELLSEIYDSLKDDRYIGLLEKINEILTVESNVRGGAKYFSRLYAVKPNVNELLDTSRTIYSRIIDKMNEIVQQLSEEYELPLTMAHNMARGFHIQMNIRRNLNQELPSIFEVIQRKGLSVLITTPEIKRMNLEVKDIIDEIQIMSNVIIAKLLAQLRQEIDVIYSLTGAISELDVLQSLAHASQMSSYCLPSFGKEMRVVDAIHPLLEHCYNKPIPVANSIIATPEYNFTIVTGPNMGGKTVYLQTVAVLQILAQLGCFVPAKYAQFRVCDKLLSRLTSTDKANVEQHTSTFVAEIKEMDYILSNMTPNSLVIIDELCRSTDPVAGRAIAWKICEKIIHMNGSASDGKYFNDPNSKSKSNETNGENESTTTSKGVKLKDITAPYVYFATHIMELTKLADIYYNVFNIHVTADEEIVDGFLKLKHHHKIDYNVTPISGYGLALANSNRLPASILSRAQQLIKETGPSDINESIFGGDPNTTTDTVKISRAERHLYDLYSNLATFNRKGRKTHTELNGIFDSFMATEGATEIIDAIRMNRIHRVVPNINQDFTMTVNQTHLDIIDTTPINLGGVGDATVNSTRVSDLSLHSIQRRAAIAETTVKRVDIVPIPEEVHHIIDTSPHTPINSLIPEVLLASPQQSQAASNHSISNREYEMDFEDSEELSLTPLNTGMLENITQYCDQSQEFNQSISSYSDVPQSKIRSQNSFSTSSVQLPKKSRTNNVSRSHSTTFYNVSSLQPGPSGSRSGSVVVPSQKSYSGSEKSQPSSEEKSKEQFHETITLLADILKRKMAGFLPIKSKQFGVIQKRSIQLNPRPKPKAVPSTSGIKRAGHENTTMSQRAQIYANRKQFFAVDAKDLEESFSEDVTMTSESPNVENQPQISITRKTSNEKPPPMKDLEEKTKTVVAQKESSQSATTSEQQPPATTVVEKLNEIEEPIVSAKENEAVVVPDPVRQSDEGVKDIQVDSQKMAPPNTTTTTSKTVGKKKLELLKPRQATLKRRLSF